MNGRIPENMLEGEYRKVRLPSADDVADYVIRLGRGCHLFTLDVARAYRVLRTDPWDWPLTGVYANGKYYVDRSVQFGARTGVLFCTLVNSATTK